MQRCNACWLPANEELCRDCTEGVDTPHSRLAMSLAHISERYAQEAVTREAADRNAERQRRYRARKQDEHNGALAT